MRTLAGYPAPVAVRISLLLSSFLALDAACQRAERAPPNGQADTVPAPVTATVTTASALPTGGGAAAPVDPALDSACTLATSLTREALGLGLVRDSATTFTSPREGQLPWHGCRLTASSLGVQKDPAHPVMPDGPLQAAFLAAGWKDDFDYGADGPDGTELGMRKGDVLCHLAISYPDLDTPDDDSAEPPTSPPLTAIPYSLVVRCTRNAPPLSN